MFIQNVEKYIQKSERQLSNKDYSEKPPNNPSYKHQNIANSMTTFEQTKVINERKLLTPRKQINQKPQNFLLHQRSLNQGTWAALSSVNCHTTISSKFVDHYLQFHTQALGSSVKYISDHITNICKLKGNPKDSVLVT